MSNDISNPEAFQVSLGCDIFIKKLFNMLIHLFPAEDIINGENIFEDLYDQDYSIYIPNMAFWDQYKKPMGRFFLLQHVINSHKFDLSFDKYEENAKLHVIITPVKIIRRIRDDIKKIERLNNIRIVGQILNESRLSGPDEYEASLLDDFENQQSDDTDKANILIFSNTFYDSISINYIYYLKGVEIYLGDKFN